MEKEDKRSKKSLSHVFIGVNVFLTVVALVMMSFNVIKIEQIEHELAEWRAKGVVPKPLQETPQNSEGGSRVKRGLKVSCSLCTVRVRER